MAARVLIATRSAAKARELRELLQLPGLELVSLDELGIAGEIPEDGQTFDENAVKKALGYARLADLPAIADDSGLEVDALGGAPGVRTRRFAGPDASDEENNAHLLRLLEGVPPERRTARYRCTLALVEGPGAGVVAMPRLTHGKLEGRIALSPRGEGGFGYDPVFYIPRLGCTLAQVAIDEKDRISHRGRAAGRIRPILRQLIESGTP